jgi:protein-S-isoprenylcysteine O-methyltransferase Ste14
MNLFAVLLYSLTGLWVAFEIGLIIRDRIQGKGKPGRDKGSIYFNFIGIAAGMTIAGFVNGNSAFFFSHERTILVFCIGTIIMLMGLGFRIWAIITLGKSFRTTVETHQGQKVITKGPYKLLRHPSYTGLLLTGCGYGIALQNWLSLIFAVVLPLAALLYRIHIEERAMVESLGTEYQTYQRSTKKLIPWIW